MVFHHATSIIVPFKYTHGLGDDDDDDDDNGHGGGDNDVSTCPSLRDIVMAYLSPKDDDDDDNNSNNNDGEYANTIFFNRTSHENIY